MWPQALATTEFILNELEKLDKNSAKPELTRMDDLLELAKEDKKDKQWIY